MSYSDPVKLPPIKSLNFHRGAIPDDDVPDPSPSARDDTYPYVSPQHSPSLASPADSVLHQSQSLNHYATHPPTYSPSHSVHPSALKRRNLSDAAPDRVRDQERSPPDYYAATPGMQSPTQPGPYYPPYSNTYHPSHQHMHHSQHYYESVSHQPSYSSPSFSQQAPSATATPYPIYPSQPPQSQHAARHQLQQSPSYQHPPSQAAQSFSSPSSTHPHIPLPPPQHHPPSYETWAPPPLPVSSAPPQHHTSPPQQYHSSPSPAVQSEVPQQNQAQAPHNLGQSHSHADLQQQPQQPAVRPMVPVSSHHPSNDSSEFNRPKVEQSTGEEPIDEDESKRGMITTVQTFNSIIEHCNAIYTFASRYSSLSTAQPTVPTGYSPSSASRNRHPPPGEIQEMTQRAKLVLDLVERIKKDKTGSECEEEGPLSADGATRKRVWEKNELKHNEEYVRSYQYPPETEPSAGITAPAYTTSSSYSLDDIEFKDPEARTLAEKDMMTIRSKRSAAAAVAAANASATASQTTPGSATPSAAPGDKNTKKNRKRGRTPLPGKCHSCNIRETPEWRRGPDGARTLCNACGLHYAKLVRKRDKALTTSAATNNPADALPIDMEMVRASSQRGGGGSSGEQSGHLDASHPSTPTHATLSAAPAPAHSATGHTTGTHTSKDDQEQRFSKVEQLQSPPVSHHDTYRVTNSSYAHTHPSFTGMGTLQSTSITSSMSAPTPPWKLDDKSRYGAMQEYARPKTSDERSGSP